MKISRKWSMPNHLTFKIKPISELIQNYIVSGTWLDPFANNSTIKSLVNHNVNVVTNDLNSEYKTDYNLDAIDFFKLFNDNSIDGILYDPPYSTRQVVECYKHVGKPITQETTRSSWKSAHKKQIARLVKPNGIVISFGWNSNGIGKSLGFSIREILLVPHGGQHYDTICTVEIKE